MQVQKQTKWLLLFEVKSSQVIQSCPTPHVDCSLPGSSIHGILQARILEWVTISFSRGSSQPRDWTRVSHIGGRCFNRWATRQAHLWFRSLHFQVVYYVVIDNWYRHTLVAIKKKMEWLTTAQICYLTLFCRLEIQHESHGLKSGWRQD